MELASCLINLTVHNQVRKPSVTPPEVAILRAMHQKNYTQGDPVVEVKIHSTDWKNYNPATEVHRLRAKYGFFTKDVYWFDKLFPGAEMQPKLIPQTFKEVEFIRSATMTGTVSPVDMKLPGEPGYVEPETLGDGEKPVVHEPPVPQDPTPSEPEN